jgi:hypothetical protein
MVKLIQGFLQAVRSAKETKDEEKSMVDFSFK